MPVNTEKSKKNFFVRFTTIDKYLTKSTFVFFKKIKKLIFIKISMSLFGLNTANQKLFFQKF